MIQRQQQHADETAEDEIHAIEQEQGGAFLHGHDVEKAVHQLGRVDIVERLRRHPRQAVGEVGGRAHEDAALDDVGDVVLEAIDDGLQRQAREKRDGKHDEGLQIRRLLAAEREIAHDGIHRKRRGEVEDSCEDGENEERLYVLPFGAQEAEKAAHRAEVGVAVAVRIMLAMGTHPVRGPLGMHDAGFHHFMDSAEPEHFRELRTRDREPVRGMVAVSDPQVEPSRMRDDEPAGILRLPDHDRRVMVRLPDGLRERHPDGRDAHVHLRRRRDELAQGIAAAFGGILDGDSRAFVLELGAGDRCELRQDARVDRRIFG